MSYTDAQGRPEIVMHPDIVRGAASHRVVTSPAGAGAGAADPTGGPADTRTDHQGTVVAEPAEGPAGAPVAAGATARPPGAGGG